MTPSVWATRRGRAAELVREAPHAEEILVFYIQLLEIQELVAKRVPVGAWNTRAAPKEAGQHLSIAGLPETDLLGLFGGFLVEVTNIGTDAIAAGSTELLEAGPDAKLACLREASGFQARAFLEPILASLAAASEPIEATGDGGRCPVCGSRPVVGTLRDAHDAQGARSLGCSLCGTEWRADRLRCAGCGERNADKLRLHSAESVPWVRLDECQTCGCYLKTVDLRVRGGAVPVVDELATVELDLWAHERGLTKLQKNVLEL